MPPPALVLVCVLFHMVVDHNSEVNGYLQISHLSCTLSTISVASCVYICVGEWGWGVEGSRLEAWMKSHKSEVAIT